ncbi:Ubiquitin-activating enzyme E1 1 [Apostasia shenzhenica]|uniref:E1 ubiquitin-activating enzyme n=1 Tax=Apostasia shenzhenica TaxID=1088818 RepID=A0A2I0BH38_9ASPA|nr:Ubiquitin-activating enzyme E1 1 [Apostasia shenzhenica]
MSSSEPEPAEVVTENNESMDQGVDPESNGSKPQENDLELPIRQMPDDGMETVRRIFASNVLISGLNGLGVEIAKNVVLAGVKSVTLHDEEDVQQWDLSSNFFFSEDDIGQNRALACMQKLQELNYSVMILTSTERLLKEQLSNFQFPLLLKAVVFTDVSLEKAIEYDEFCHNHKPPIAFIKSEVRGLFGSMFCDFGPNFTVYDVDGEESHMSIIASINNDNPATVYCINDERLELQDGDLVVFSEVDGMNELNDGKPRKVRDVRPYSFTLEEDTTTFGKYVKGGIVTQLKLPKILHFKPLKVALKEPGDYLLCDFSKYDRPALLHLAFQALDKFRHDLGRLPVAGSEEDARRLLNFFASINMSSGVSKLEKIDNKLLCHFASGSRAVLNPMAAIFGGITGQEVVKACSGKFHPTFQFQFFYFDSVESLPDEPLKADDLMPLNTRYDAQISVFGSKLQTKLKEAKVFMVGSGALGCEFLKNLALMGVCCSPKGKLTLTDDNFVEKSYLNPHFVFHDCNIGEAKSTVAVTAANSINPALHVEALQNHVSPETDDVYNDAFWDSLDVVISALDNVNARLYIDSQCVYYQKPLLESGTLGIKCSTQMIIPHLTENYGSSRDPPEMKVHTSTVHSMPHNIDDCLAWARSEFESLLEKAPIDVNNFLSNPTEFAASIRRAGNSLARELLERVLECLEVRCETFEDCIKWARLKFEDYFTNCVKQLQFAFRVDSASITGASIQCAPKHFLRPLQFSSSDPGHLQFIMAASALRAQAFRIDVPEWGENQEILADIVDKVMVPQPKPKKDAKIDTDVKTTSPSTASIGKSEVIEGLLSELEVCAERLPPGFRMNPIQFEMDHDANHHMEFIAILANMRARNYGIPEVCKLQAKLIARRIIPHDIATSKALAAGLVCLELYKVLAGGHKREDYRNTFANLALPFFSSAEPVAPKEYNYRYMTWTVWDRWIIHGNLTLRDLLIWLYRRGLNPYRISCGTSLLYNSMFTVHKYRMEKKIVDLAREVAMVELPPYKCYLDLVVTCEDDGDTDINIPLITVYFR